MVGDVERPRPEKAHWRGSKTCGGHFAHRARAGIVYKTMDDYRIAIRNSSGANSVRLALSKALRNP